jgi:hypothetical protein
MNSPVGKSKTLVEALQKGAIGDAATISLKAFNKCMQVQAGANVTLTSETFEYFHFLGFFDLGSLSNE